MGFLKRCLLYAEGAKPFLCRPVVRSCFLFSDFFLIITALYLLKPTSRSFFIENLGAEMLPYVWIGTALTMGTFIGYYNRLIVRRARLHVVLGSCMFFIILLLFFSAALAGMVDMPALVKASAAGYYIFVDIVGVILVEQFWSLSNAVHTAEEGKHYYGFIGTGGLVGGVAGGGISAFLLQKAHLDSADILLVAAGVLLLIFALTLFLGWLGVYDEVRAKDGQRGKEAAAGWRALFKNRYIGLIALLLLLAQLASPLVDYQFLSIVEQAYTDLDKRTAFLSLFFSILGGVAIAINLAVTPLVHRYLGVIAGLLVQPLLMGIASFGFFLQPVALMGAISKVSDRGLSYSINRASKEILYVPVDPVLMYQAKAWIDMFGYRLFKVLGSMVILLLTQWLPFKVQLPHLSFLIMGICGIWIAIIWAIRPEYYALARTNASGEEKSGGLS
ncbi:ATP translocase [Oceanidesulfovibrio indonesiensis]|uniref:ADP,ATP carrier protein n=1 Tax=Oceanidesulfovibrio indonesiensis TaxID=54767 RepID=A0A7M3MFZ5_9BACT|nr:Npt1/Npt2 family nucleotide transporter [Oceanidesulfovibrio indonesiensis]TVM17971.1 ATP translocase [Oceanidesulfovibrio indonesiensis]